MIEKENFYLLVATFFWALGLIIGKFCSAEMPPMTLTFVRYLLAGLGMGIIHFFKEKELKIAKNDILYIFILAFLGIVLNGVLFFKGIGMTSPINTSIISSTTPAIVCIIGVLFFHEKVNIKNIVSIICSITGILILLTNGNLESLINIRFNKGDLIILGAIISNGIYIIGSKKILKKYESTKILTYLFIFTAIILLPSLYLERNMYVLNQVSLKAILSLIYMGLFSSLIAFLLQQKGIKKIGPVKASIYTNLIPIYSIILSSLILKERVTLIQIIAMILVMLAIIINMETKKDKKIDK
ncbi:DMT family transporter [Fusobacterium sp.]|uniref:DMT family transporter n=1 Tax=Fusobacterium sp. TaxID=68766 RepID=UPI0015A66054|nr:DMT family transporter [Fusobacterium sp.]MDY3059957.1 DMT family transporter [Fusobacterium sp.]